MHGDDALFQYFAVAPHSDLRRADLGAVILDAEADCLRLADDAEARCGREHHAAIDFIGMTGDQRMHRRGKTQCAYIGRHVVHAAIGNHDGAGNAVGRHVGKCRGERGKQLGAVVFTVGLACLRHTHFEAGNVL